MSVFRTPEFRRLQAEWARLLRESGFEDIETPDGQLRSPSPIRARRYDRTQAWAREEYFRRAGFYLHEGDFWDMGEMEVWALHADGVTVRGIANRVGLHRSSVNRRIQRHKKAAGLWVRSSRLASAGRTTRTSPTYVIRG